MVTWILYIWLLILTAISLAILTSILAFNMLWNRWHDYHHALKALLVSFLLCMFTYIVYELNIYSLKELF